MENNEFEKRRKGVEKLFDIFIISIQLVWNIGQRNLSFFYVEKCW